MQDGKATSRARVAMSAVMVPSGIRYALVFCIVISIYAKSV